MKKLSNSLNTFVMTALNIIYFNILVPVFKKQKKFFSQFLILEIMKVKLFSRKKNEDF